MTTLTCTVRLSLALAIVAFPAPGVFAQQQCAAKQNPQQLDAHIDAMIANMSVDERIAQLGDRAPAIPRLGLPAYNWWNEGLHGLARDGYATVFPQAIGLAATWDPSLMRDVGNTVSTEARAKFNALNRIDTPRYGGLTVWSPNINIFRDPRWGRGQETYGEDPFLTASLGLEFVRGVQGDDPFYLRADATPKHFAAHSGPEFGRDSFNAVVSPHDLADTYLQAFHALLERGHAAAVMCSYNAINGIPSCANRVMLDEVVRGKWHFDGYVVSDCDAVGNISTYQHYAPDAAHGAAAALEAGVDLDCGNSYAALRHSYDAGLVSSASIDRALHRLLLARAHLGMLDRTGCSPYDAIVNAEIDSPQHRARALRAAEESIVLLQNGGVLPLKPAAQRIAVIGPTADMIKVLEANYHGTASSPVTPLDGLRATFSHVSYAQGSLLANGVPAPLPRNVLRSGVDAASKSGLTAEYFDSPSFDGKPVVTSHVEKIDLDLDRVTPTPAIHSARYAARWSGYLFPPATGDYVLRVDIERCWDCAVHDRFQLFVDGKLVLDNHGAKSDPDRVTLHFAGLAPHAVRLELAHTGDDEGIALEWIPPASALLDEAVEAARRADVSVVFVGLSPDLEGEALQFESEGFANGDRTSLQLPAPQRELLTHLLALPKPLVVVLTSGSAVQPGIELGKDTALLEAWYPGEAGGEALAHILSGAVNPSGRLPITFYRSAADLPAFTDYSMKNRTYRYFDGPVLFPFGFGLSYTSFSYGPVSIPTKQFVAGQPFSVQVTVKNTGALAGADVAELYLVPPPSPENPRLALRGFQRVTLGPGESKQLSFTLTPEQLSFVDQAGREAIRSGKYALYIRSVQPRPGIDSATEFEIIGDQPLD